jgi:hypothetical protein
MSCSNQCISPLNQLLTMLRYFATGSHIVSVADYMGMDSTTAGIHKVSRAVSSLYRRFIKFPSTEEEKGVTKEGFFRVARFPNVGALDCTHIKIKSPGKNVMYGFLFLQKLFHRWRGC